MSHPVAIVTGGARGIGRAVALDLARSGSPVAVCYRSSAAEADRTVAELRAFGVGALALQADVARPAECARFVERVRGELGPVGILVNGAGPYRRSPILQETDEGWRSMFDGNLHSAFTMCRLVAPDMIAANRGRIVSFAMANADRLMAQPNVTAHFIAKMGILVLTRTLARELGRHGITVNAVSPGYIDSGSPDADDPAAILPRIPAGRLGTVDDAVHAVRFLLSDEAGYVNGTNIHVNGGWGV